MIHCERCGGTSTLPLRWCDWCTRYLCHDCRPIHACNLGDDPR